MFRTQFDNISKDVIELITRMAYLAEIKEWDNRSHLERIRKYVSIILSGLDMLQQDLDIIANASMLHDIGKAQLPEILLSKSGQFDRDEWKIIESHTLKGAEMLAGSSVPILQVAESISRSHHERWDGSGYPFGLKGKEIPLPGRIVALADIFDALTTQRSYKESVEYSIGLEMIKDSSGKLLDPELVQIFSSKFTEILRSIKI